MSITVNAVHRRVQFTGNGSNLGPFSFSFKVLASTDIKVSVGTTEKTVTTHFTTSLNADGTGAITFTSGNAPANNAIVTIESDQAIERTSDFTTGGDFTASAINDDLDRLTINDQQIETLLSRNVQLPATVNRTTSGTGTSGPLFFPYADTESDQANKTIAFNSDGTGLELGPSATDITTANASAATATTKAAEAAASATGAAASASAATTNGAAQVALATTQATNAAASATAAAASAAAAEVTIASQAEAEAGTNNANLMTPLRAKQAVDSYGVITSTDVATSGANKILKLDGSGHLPALNGSNLTNLPITDVSVDVRFLALQVASDRIGLEDGIADPYSDETDVDNSASTNETHVSATSHFIGRSTTTEAPNGSGDWTGKTGSFTLTNDDISGGADGAVFWSDQLLTGDFSVSFTSAANPGFGMIGVFAASEVGTFDSTDGGDGDLGDMTDSFFILRSSSTSRAHCGSTDEAAASEFGSVVWKFERSGGTIKVVRDGSLHHTYTTRTTTADMRLAFASLGGHSISFQNISASIPVLANLTLQSNAFTADAAPATAVIGVQVVENESITVNTDLTAEVSRNGGSNFTTCTLALKSTLGATSTKYYESASTDISGQPSGTSMKYRVKSLNDKDIEVHGVTVKWSE